MQRVFKGGALVVLIAILIAPALYADDPPGPPEARVRIPGGFAGQQEPPTVFGLFWVWLQGRLGPPIG
jgi:hypothetical protein